MNKRPNRGSNPSSQAKQKRKGRFQYTRKKKRETKDLLRRMP